MFGMNRELGERICAEIVAKEFQPLWDAGRAPKPNHKKYKQHREARTRTTILRKAK